MTVMMKTARILVPLVLAVAAPGLLPPAAAMAGHVSRPVAVSGRSPFRLGCTGAGRGFAHGAEVEPSLAADPADPSQAYVVWDRQDLTRHGGQPAWFARTTDRGRTWSQPKIIYDPTAQGGSTEGNIITVLPGGTLVDIFLYAAIGLIPPDGPSAPGTPAAHATRRVPTQIRAVISHNQGRTWSRPVIVARIGYRDHGF